MVGDILRIKTTIPPLSGNILSRPQIKKRLFDELSVPEGFSRSLTVISAPAGFGKTTLVRDWLSGREKETAWLSLDEEDNEPERFWIYLVSALQTIAGSVGDGTMESLRSQGLVSGSAASRKALLTPLLNGLFSLQTPLFLMLDDYHLIDNTFIHEDMAFFIENMPPALHLVVATRSDPPWPLSRWRAKGKMMEIRMGELLFSEEETGKLCAGFEGLVLSEKQLQLLHEKTEGWITGLQLAAISLAASRDKDRFIADFAGSHRHILHFLSEEVIHRQADTVRDFLMQTSILNRFCASLCDAVTGREDCAELLARLERENLFVIPLDDSGLWYRYHHLFADLLFYQLKGKDPDGIHLLHEKASRWFFEHGEYSEAVRHAFIIGGFEEAARILHEKYDDIIYTEGSGQLIRCLESIPADLLKKYPRLVVQKALYALIFKGSKEAEPYLELAAELGYEDSLEQQEFTGMLHALKAYHHIFMRQLDEALENAERALKLLPAQNYYWRMNVSIYSGDAGLFSGRPREAYPLYREALRNSEKMESKLFTLTTGFKVATSLYYLGRLEEAEAHTREYLRVARDMGPARMPRTGLLWTLLGGLHQEKGDLEEAARCVERGLFLSRSEIPSLGWNMLYKVALSYAQGAYAQALVDIAEIESIDLESSLPFFVTGAAHTWKARILLETGDFSGAGEILKRVGATLGAELQAGRERDFLTLCRWLKASTRDYEPSALAEMAEAVEKSAAAGGEHRIMLESLLLRAELEEVAGDGAKAEQFLKKALLEGEKCGYFQLFVNEGRNLVPLFARLSESLKSEKPAAEDGSLQPLIERILTILAPDIIQSRDMPGEAAGSTAPWPGQGRVSKVTTMGGAGAPGDQPAKNSSLELVEDLSPRELEVLTLISRGHSNKAISDKLFLSLGTVKWHTTNIYGKLGVRSRTEAVALGREIGIIA